MCFKPRQSGIMLGLFLVCLSFVADAGKPTFAQGATATETTSGSSVDTDIYDDALVQENRREDMVDGLPYKPDAIPLSQYRRDTDPLDGTSALTRTTDITGNGTRQRSYYAAIYSGSTNGVYFQVAASICDMMRRTYKRHRVSCVPLRSQGVGSNIQLMKEGRVQLAIVQSNNNWEAQKGINPIPGARSVMSLHDEMGLLVVREDAEIDSIGDLRGKRINIGPEGSASRELWLQLLKQYDIDFDEIETVYDVAQDYNRQGICENYIDAYGLWIGHPSNLIEESIDCGARVVGMDGPPTRELVKDNSYFFEQTLPAKTYKNQPEAIQSYGFKASLIAADAADPYVIYWITRIIDENIEQLKTENPNFRSIQSGDLLAKGNFLPFHKGAACYWQIDPHSCDWQILYEDLARRSKQAAQPYTYQQ